MNIQKGNTLKIGKEKFDVLRVIEEIDWCDVKKNKVLGEHATIVLHKFGDSSLQRIY